MPSPFPPSYRTYTISSYVYHILQRTGGLPYYAWRAPRRDAGLLKLVEVQFKEEAYEYLWEEDVRTLTQDGFEMRVEKWDPPWRGPFVPFEASAIAFPSRELLAFAVVCPSS